MRDYVALITSEHRDKPRFAAVVQALTQPLAQVAASALGLSKQFDVDSAVGVQLDAVGLWVGVPRVFTVPISGAFFSFDTQNLGWNEGFWKGPETPGGGINVLDDATYRIVIKARIARNYWDGTYQQQIEILAADLAAVGLTLVPIDHFDMSMVLHVLGVPTAVMMELIQRGYIVPKPAGVQMSVVLGPDGEGGNTFALDSVTSGLDSGVFL